MARPEGMHWTGGSVGTRGDQHFGGEMSHWVDSHFGDDEDLMEGGPALLIGVEDLDADCEDMAGCGSPGANPWADVSIHGSVDFGGDGPVAALKNWWAARKAKQLAALATASGRGRRLRRPTSEVARAGSLASRPTDSGDDTLDTDSEAAPPGTSSLPIGAGGLVYGSTSLSDRSFI